MKILAINASHRGDQGYTHFLINLLFEGARQAGAECESIALAQHKINRCLGCWKCHTPEHHLKCVYEDKDDVPAIFNRIAEVDLLVYATPIYVFTISSLLKTFLERFNGISDCNEIQLSRSGLIFHHVNSEVCSKPFVALICCDNFEDDTPRSAVQYFKVFSKFLDAPLVGTLVRNGGQASGQGRDPEKEKRMPKIKDVYEAYRQAGRELALEGQIHPATQRKANQEIIPVPFFGLLKHLPFFKREAVRRAGQFV